MPPSYRPVFIYCQWLELLCWFTKRNWDSSVWIKANNTAVARTSPISFMSVILRLATSHSVCVHQVFSQQSPPAPTCQPNDARSSTQPDPVTQNTRLPLISSDIYWKRMSVRDRRQSFLTGKRFLMTICYGNVRWSWWWNISVERLTSLCFHSVWGFRRVWSYASPSKQPQI